MKLDSYRISAGFIKHDSAALVAKAGCTHILNY